MIRLRDQYQVEGLDLDEAVLEIARQRLPSVPLHQRDIADLNLGREFDAVVNLFSSIAYVRTPEKVYGAIVNK